MQRSVVRMSLLLRWVWIMEVWLLFSQNLTKQLENFKNLGPPSIQKALMSKEDMDFAHKFKELEMTPTRVWFTPAVFSLSLERFSHQFFFLLDLLSSVLSRPRTSSSISCQSPPASEGIFSRPSEQWNILSRTWIVLTWPSSTASRSRCCSSSTASKCQL